MTVILAALFGILKAQLWPFLIALGTATFTEYLKRKALADAGAARQKAAQDAVDAAAAASAGKTADAVHNETDDQFAADAGNWR